MPTLIVETDEAIERARQKLEHAPALFHEAIVKNTNATVKSGRAKLVSLLWSAMAARWKTIIKRRVHYKPYNGEYAEVRLSNEPMQATSFKGKFSNGPYTVQVLKSGWNVVVPSAFKGRGIDNKLAIFSRDVNAPKKIQTVGHYKKNIGKMRSPTHKAAPITMTQVIQKRPEISENLRGFMAITFAAQMNRSVIAVVGGAR